MLLFILIDCHHFDRLSSFRLLLKTVLLKCNLDIAKYSLLSISKFRKSLQRPVNVFASTCKNEWSPHGKMKCSIGSVFACCMLTVTTLYAETLYDCSYWRTVKKIHCREFYLKILHAYSFLAFPSDVLPRGFSRPRLTLISHFLFVTSVIYGDDRRTVFSGLLPLHTSDTKICHPQNTLPFLYSQKPSSATASSSRCNPRFVNFNLVFVDTDQNVENSWEIELTFWSRNFTFKF